MTEDEAKTKFCCGPAMAANPDRLEKCIGVLCMAWRWKDTLNAPPTDGYCGLAGEPRT